MRLFSLITLLMVAGAWGSAGHWPLYLLAGLLALATWFRPLPFAILAALASGLGYWASSEPLTHTIAWCLPAAVAGWFLARQTGSYRDLVLVTAAAVAFTVPAGLAPLPASALLVASALGRWSVNRG